MIHDRDVVAHLLDLVEEVGRDEHRPAFALDERSHQLTELDHSGRVETVRRLVEDEQLGLVEKSPGDTEPLAHAL